MVAAVRRRTNLKDVIEIVLLVRLSRYIL